MFDFNIPHHVVNSKIQAASRTVNSSLERRALGFSHKSLSGVRAFNASNLGDPASNKVLPTTLL